MVLLVLVTACDSTETAARELLVFRNVNAIDAVNGLRNRVTVVIRGNRITRVTTASELNLSKDAKTIDATGKYLIPGLWDAHVHLSYDQEITPAMFQLFLVNGITSIRDTGGQLQLVLPWREKARQDSRNTPRVMLAGPLLDGKPAVYDGSSRANPELGIGAGTAADAERLVDEFAAAGVDLIKAYEMLSPEAFQAVINRATSKGLQVTGHVPLSMDVISASNAGLRSMEHLRNLEMSCSAHSEQLLEIRRRLLKEGAHDLGSVLRSRIHRAQRMRAVNTQDEATREKVVKALAENGTWQIPTLTILTDQRFHARPHWPETVQHLPESVRRRWTENAERSSSSPASSARAAFAQWAFDMIGHLSRAGVGMMAGTDCPIALLTPGYSLHEELRLFVQAGLTPLQALETATWKPAQYFCLEEELGTIAENMLADLILLDANPLEDIDNTRRIRAVVRDGKLHDRNGLDRMLQALEAR
jgi:imidazolonepropionase-like amidohydrolase